MQHGKGILSPADEAPATASGGGGNFDPQDVSACMRVAGAARVSADDVKCSANLNRKWTAQVCPLAFTALNAVRQSIWQPVNKTGHLIRKGEPPSSNPGPFSRLL